MRGGDVGIGAVVNVEHGRLRTLEEDLAPCGDLLVDEGDRISDMRTQTFGIALILLQDFLVDERRVIVDRGELLVLALEVALQLLGELLAVHQIADANADAVVAVHVAGADAAPGRADLVRAALRVADAVHQAVVGHDNMRAVGDEDVRRVNAARRERIHLLQADLRVEGNAVRDDVVCALVEDARRQEAQLVLLAPGDNGVPRVAAALIADNGIRLRREVVDDLPFALVAPLCSGNNDG